MSKDKQPESIKDAVAAGPATATPKGTDLVELMIARMGVSKITAKSFLANAPEADRKEAEKLALAGEGDKAFAKVYQIRHGLMEKQKASIELKKADAE